MRTTNPTINFHHIDCMEFMKDKPDGYYDLGIIDPPYGINAGKMTMGSGKHRFAKGKNWDAAAPSNIFFEEFFRVSKNQIIWGGNYFDLPLNNNWVVWDKLNPNLSFSEAELAWCSINNNVRIFKRLSTLPDIDGTKQHPTQKPVALYKWLLDKYAKPGDKILDTHGGSGSIAIACHDYGYDLDICELDAEYYEKALKRFETHRSQLILF